MCTVPSSPSPSFPRSSSLFFRHLVAGDRKVLDVSVETPSRRACLQLPVLEQTRHRESHLRVARGVPDEPIWRRPPNSRGDASRLSRAPAPRLQPLTRTRRRDRPRPNPNPRRTARRRRNHTTTSTSRRHASRGARPTFEVFVSHDDRDDVVLEEQHRRRCRRRGRRSPPRTRARRSCPSSRVRTTPRRAAESSSNPSTMDS